MGSSISTAERTTDQQCYAPEDILAVRSSLLVFVPLELADMILDHAKYWSKATWTFKPKRSMSLDSKSNHKGNATACCLLTPKLCDLLYSGDGVAKMKAVCFNIISYDQCSLERDQHNFSGAYEGSHTGFEAVIVRDLIYGRPAIGPSSAKLELEWIRQALSVRADGIYYPHCKVVTVKTPNDENSDTWDIQRNKRSTKRVQLHTVVWTEEVEEDVNESTLMNETGRGLGRGFVRSLMKDDRIAVMARAQRFSHNHIESVDLVLYYSV